MREIDAETAADYLRETGRVARDAEILVRELSGGVSNIVLRVDVSGRPPMVLKQCRERLRVAMEWRARLDRIWAESATLEVLRSVLAEGESPRVLFEDRENYLFAMACAPDDAVTWKSQLMAGRADPAIAARLGTDLAAIHAEAPKHPALGGTLADASLFEELRIDPYYRTVARRIPATAPFIERLIASMDRPSAERTLVWGDFSPKNILVHGGGLVLLDFECGHAGDRAFDLGFFLSHLLLKSLRAHVGGRPEAEPLLGLTETFWETYLERSGLDLDARIELVQRAALHAAACCLARVDGKSPVEYLDAAGQAVARAFGCTVFLEGPMTWGGTLYLLRSVWGRGA